LAAYCVSEGMRNLRKTICHFYRTTGMILAVVCVLFALPPAGFSAVLYRSYVVKYDRGWDILCDAYRVQKDDWVYKIFRQKGEISSSDFREFLSIFKRLNPHIRDIDRIRPTQNILIPLKKLEPGTLPGQSSGVVTIPFVSISKVSEILESHSEIYRVKEGDTVSKLIAGRFGSFGTRSYREGLSLFKALNPDILNLNIIRTGQNIFLPDPAMRNEPWYHSLFDAHGDIKGEKGAAEQIESERVEAYGTIPTQDEPTPLYETAALLDATLLNKGTYFFPRKSNGDFELDLSRFPVFEMENGKRIVFRTSGDGLGIDMDILKSRWQEVEVVTLQAEASIEQILEAVFSARDQQHEKENVLSFTDHGLHITVRAQWIKAKPVDNDGKSRHICITMVENSTQQTPKMVSRYLDWHGIIIRDVLKKKSASLETKNPENPKFVQPDVTVLASTDHRVFVKGLMQALGYAYSENVSITFPYAGIQVEAVSNMVTTGNGNDFLVDFGDLYGDAAQEIEKTGLGMVRVSRQASLDEATRNILTALDATYAVDPLFIAAARPAEFNTVLKVPGYLVSRPGARDILLSSVPLHNRLLQFLNARDVKVVLTGLGREL